MLFILNTTQEMSNHLSCTGDVLLDPLGEANSNPSSPSLGVYNALVTLFLPAPPRPILSFPPNARADDVDAESAIGGPIPSDVALRGGGGLPKNPDLGPRLPEDSTSF